MSYARHTEGNIFSLTVPKNIYKIKDYQRKFDRNVTIGI